MSRKKRPYSQQQYIKPQVAKSRVRLANPSQEMLQQLVDNGALDKLNVYLSGVYLLMTVTRELVEDANDVLTNNGLLKSEMLFKARCAEKAFTSYEIFTRDFIDTDGGNRLMDDYEAFRDAIYNFLQADVKLPKQIAQD